MKDPRRQWSAHLVVLCFPVALIASACSSSGAVSNSPAPTGTVAGSGGGSASGSGPNPNATETPPPGDIPDNQAFVPYTPPGHGYSLKVPEGWAMTLAAQATLFTDKFNSIRVEKLTLAQAPTIASATATELPTIKAATHGYAPGAVTAVARTAGKPIEITYRADSPPNAVTGKVVVEAVERYEFWRNGAEIVLTLSSPVGSDNVDPWRKVTDSFAWRA
ncbi:MAG: hypothetical protein ACR2LX_17380 [Jatrophihabitans sp.]